METQTAAPAANARPLSTKIGPPNKKVGDLAIANGNTGLHSKEALRQARKAAPLPPKAPPAKVAKTGKTVTAAKPAKKTTAPKAPQKWTVLKKAIAAREGSNRYAWIQAVMSVKDSVAAYALTVKCGGVKIAGVNAGHIKWCADNGYIKLA
jgi:hypothetical protein